jgi:hypothetical protein
MQAGEGTYEVDGLEIAATERKRSVKGGGDTPSRPLIARINAGIIHSLHLAAGSGSIYTGEINGIERSRVLVGGSLAYGTKARLITGPQESPVSLSQPDLGPIHNRTSSSFSGVAAQQRLAGLDAQVASAV